MAFLVHLNNAGRRADPLDLFMRPVEWSFDALTGPDTARIDVSGPLGQLWGLLDWLAVDLSILDSVAGEVWYGFVHEVQLRAGQSTYTTSLDLIANRVRAMGGEGESTADNLNSQALYGIHERIISVPDSAPFTTIQEAAARAAAEAAFPEAVVTAAAKAEKDADAVYDAARTAYEAEKARREASPYVKYVDKLEAPQRPERGPKSAADLKRERDEGIAAAMATFHEGLAASLAKAAPGLTGWGSLGYGPGDGSIGATLTCRGHLQALNWRYYTHAAGGVVDAVILLEDLIQGYGAYTPDVVSHVPGGLSGISWDRGGDGTRRAYDYLRDILEIGDGERRIQAWPLRNAAYNDRRLVTLELEPTPDQGPVYYVGADGRLTDFRGAPLAWVELTAGFWVSSRDIGFQGASGPLSFADRARYEVAAGRWRFEPRGFRLMRSGISLSGG